MLWKSDLNSGPFNQGDSIPYRALMINTVVGKQYTLKNAFCVQNFSVTGGQGETPVKFIGENWNEGTHG